MRIDSHQHFWRYNPTDYPWISDRMKVLKRDFLPPDLEPELISSGFQGSVAVQARQTAGETRWLLELADRFEFIRGVVGWADLRSHDLLRKQLDEFCKSEKFAGIRHVVHDEPEDGFMLRDDFLEGLMILQEYDLTYDLLLFPKHLPVANIIVSMFPRLKFVLDHISKPQIRDRIIDPWKEDIIRLSENQNLWCKLSGMVTEANPEGYLREDFRPYLDVVFEAFGPERLMIGSDWPVSLNAGQYNEVTGIVKDYISGLPDLVQERVLGGNCSRFYGLDQD